MSVVLYGNVFKWAPFDDDIDSDSFNPLDFVEEWEDIKVIADLLIPPSPSKSDTFWEDAARNLLSALIMHVKEVKPKDKQTMQEVCRLAYCDSEELKELCIEMRASGVTQVIDAAKSIETTPDKMQGSIWSSLRTPLDDWRSDRIAEVTKTTTAGWDPRKFKINMAWADMDAIGLSVPDMRGDTNEDGTLSRCAKADSVFIIMPSDKIGTFSSVLRVIMGLHINLIKSSPNQMDAEYYDGNEGKLLPKRPVMFILDELAQLGYMEIIEKAAPFVRSSRIRLWMFFQDKNQLMTCYPQAESLLANSRVEIYFKPNDMKTAKDISERLGDTETLFEGKKRAVTPQELMARICREADYFHFRRKTSSARSAIFL